MTLFYIKDDTTGLFFNDNSSKLLPKYKSKTVTNKDSLYWKFKDFCFRIVSSMISRPYEHALSDSSFHPEIFEAILNHKFVFYSNEDDSADEVIDVGEMLSDIDFEHHARSSYLMNIPMHLDVIHENKLGRYFQTKNFLINPGHIHGLERYTDVDRVKNSRFSYVKYGIETEDDEMVFRLTTDLSQVVEVDPAPLIEIYKRIKAKCST